MVFVWLTSVYSFPLLTDRWKGESQEYAADGQQVISQSKLGQWKLMVCWVMQMVLL